MYNVIYKITKNIIIIIIVIIIIIIIIKQRYLSCTSGVYNCSNVTHKV